MDHEQIDQVAHNKRANEQINGFFLSELLIRSFTHKKWVIPSKNLNKIIFLYVKTKISDLLNPSFLKSDVSEALRLLTKHEWPWAIHSDLSPKMSNRERIIQVVHQKWVNEWSACIFVQIAHSLSFLQKKTIRSESWWVDFHPCL